MGAKNFFRWVVSVGLYPLVLGVGLALVVLGLSRGYAAPLLTLWAGLWAGGLCLILERLSPFAESWRRARGGVGTNIAHFLLSMVAVIALFQWVAFGPLLAAGRALGLALWPQAWPLWGQLLLALVVAELGYYWVHRASHELSFLWRFHATHHSLHRLYWFNGGHFHPIDTLLNYSAEVVPLLLLGASPEVLVLFSAFTSMNGMLKHSNIEQRLGPLNWLLSTAELHRWHHSREAAEGNTNYGSNLALWDILFGTRFLPPGRRPPEEIGLSDMPQFPETFFAQLRAPFQWERLTSTRPEQEP